VKRISVSDMQFCIWTLPTAETFLVFYFTYCPAAEIEQLRQLEN